jgi:hypothetical protein
MIVKKIPEINKLIEVLFCFTDAEVLLQAQTNMTYQHNYEVFTVFCVCVYEHI